MTDPLGFLREFARGRAEEVSDRPFGFVVRSMQRFPHSHDHNFSSVFLPTEPAALLAEVEAEFAGVGYRRVEVASDVLTPALAAALVEAGYEREDQVVMTWLRPPDTDRPPATDVTELDVEQRVAIADRVWAEDFDQPDPAVRRELAERAHSALTAARCTFLGVVGSDGGIEASCDLFQRGDIAQIEEVSTLAPFRGRGHASRLVRAAAEQATAAGAHTVFLVAEADDWPKDLYARLGFDVTATHTVWSRSVSDR